MDEINWDYRLQNNVQQAINEEMGIDNDVYRKSYFVLDKVKEQIKSGVEYQNTECKGVKHAYFTFRIDLYTKKNFLICVNLYNFFNKDIFEKNKDNFDIYGAKTREVWIDLNLYCISGTLQENDAMEEIQHEISHNHEFFMGNKKVLSFNLKYLQAASRLFDENELTRRIANCIYLSFDFERDGFINGLYGYLMTTKKVVPVWDDIKETDIYGRVLGLEQDIHFLENYENIEEARELCKKEFGTSFGDVIKDAKETLRKFYKGIGRVLIKVRNDRINEGYGSFYKFSMNKLFTNFDHGILVD